MAYKHDIFISYRRQPDTIYWLEKHFLPKLRHHVGQELDSGDPTIFVDRRIPVGQSWPSRLGIALGGSRILIALWARNYLASSWCVEEMAQMLTREQECGLRSDANPNGIIIPVIIHDGESKHFPPPLKAIQHIEVQPYFLKSLNPEGASAEKLEKIIKENASAIASAIRAAPPWRQSWSQDAAAGFRQMLARPKLSQTAVPRFGMSA